MALLDRILGPKRYGVRITVATVLPTSHNRPAELRRYRWRWCAWLDAASINYAGAFGLVLFASAQVVDLRPEAPAALPLLRRLP